MRVAAIGAGDHQGRPYKNEGSSSASGCWVGARARERPSQQMLIVFLGENGSERDFRAGLVANGIADC